MIGAYSALGDFDDPKSLRRRSKVGERDSDVAVRRASQRRNPLLGPAKNHRILRHPQTPGIDTNRASLPPFYTPVRLVDQSS